MHPTHNIKAKAREIIYKFFQDSDGYFHKGSIKIAIEGWFDIKNLETAIDTIIDLATQAEREKTKVIIKTACEGMYAEFQSRGCNDLLTILSGHIQIALLESKQ